MPASSSPGWDDDPAVVTWPGLPRLIGDRHADACVIGLGASGLAAVDALAERGLSVIGVDAGRVGAGAAGRNGGFLLGGPAPFLHTAIARWGTDAAVGLYRATLAELDHLAATMGPALVRRCGSIRLAGLPGDPQDETEELERAAELADVALHTAALRAHAIAVEDYDGELGRGIFLPDDAAMNPAARVIALAGSVRAGVELYEHSPVTAMTAGTVTTTGGTIRAATTVVAVDGGLGQLVAAMTPSVRTARLQMLRTAPIDRRVPCPVYGRWGYDYAQADADGRLYVGGGRDRYEPAEWTTDAAPSDDVQAYIEVVAARFAGTPVEVDRRWGASVGYTTDGRAVVAQVEPGVVACGGYSGTGNLVGPIAARAAVALALEGIPPPSYFSSGSSGRADGSGGDGGQGGAPAR